MFYSKIKIIPLFILIFSCNNNQPLNITQGNNLKTSNKLTFINDVEKEKVKKEFSCTEINDVKNGLGNLEPDFPIAECIIMDRAIGFTENDYIRRSGGLFPRYLRYIIKNNSNLQLIKNNEDFRKVYSPVNSKEEALSFVLAVTNTEAKYEFKIPNTYRIYEKNINPTSSEKTNEGYKVTVFNYQQLGCGPHPYYSEIYLVKTTGEITRTEQKKLYEDPELDNLCVD